MRASRVGIALGLALVLARSAAFADPKADAKKHLKKATAAHQAGRYDEALSELNIAYALDPQPVLLYAVGQVYVMKGDCAQAITFYERFLATSPPAAPAKKATQAIETCKRLQPAAPVEPTPVEPKPVEPTPVEPAKPAPAPLPPVQLEPATPFYTDVVGDSLVVGGVVLGVIGLIEYHSALSDVDAAALAPTLGVREQLDDDAQHKRTLSIVFSGGGLVVAAAGVVRYVLHQPASTKQRTALVPTRGGGLVTWTSSF